MDSSNGLVLPPSESYSHSRESAPPPAPPAPVLENIVWRGREPIAGIQSVTQEDYEQVERIMNAALAIKCPGTDVRVAYDRARWWRVETRDGEHLLHLGGWESMGVDHMRKIELSDVGRGNIKDVYVTLAAPNNEPHKRDLTLVIRYMTEAAKRRMRAMDPISSDPPEQEHIVGKRVKRGWVSGLVDFVVNGV